MQFLRIHNTLHLLGVLWGASLTAHTSSDDIRYRNFLLNIIQRTLCISESSSIHITDHYSTELTTSLVRMLHANDVRTTVGSSLKSLEKQRGPKNIIFLIQDHCDVLSLAVNSIADLDLNTTANQNTFIFSGEITDTKRRTYLEKLDKTDGDCSEICKLLMGISEADLQVGSEIPDRLFKWKHALFHHPVWNSANHLIFAALNNGLAGPHPRPFCDLSFIFKFIWRFYRGLKSVICIGEQCFTYNPFEETISEYDPKKDTFDFSWSNMHGKTFTVSTHFSDPFFDKIFNLNHWNEMMHFILSESIEHLGGSLIFSIFGLDKYEMIQTEDVFYDADAVMFGSQVQSNEIYDTDVILTIDSGSVYFIVPEKGRMPSYLLPARCFSATVWFWTFLSCFLFVTLHETHRRFCMRTPSTTASSNSAEYVSTLFTIYRYILCIGQPRLLLDYATGRLLFGTFSFMCLVLATAFLGILVTFLSIKLRYTAPNTVEELKESDLLFQTTPELTDAFLLFDDPQFEWIRSRQVTAFSDYGDEQNFFKVMVIYDPDTDTIDMGSVVGANLSELAIRSLLSARRAIFRRDGFVVYIPYIAGRKDMLVIGDTSMSNPEKFDFHVVQECIMSYPYDLRFLSNSVYASKIKAVTRRLFEAGLTARKFMTIMGDDWPLRFIDYEEEYEKEPLRAFSMVDLRLAFIILTVGLALSSLVFVTELLRDK